MKYIKFIYCFLILFPYITFAMMSQYIELLPMIINTNMSNPSPQPTISYAHKDIIEVINKAINTKYPETNPIFDFVSNLFQNQEDMLAIVTIPFEQNQYPITLSIINTLYRKNNIFAKAIDYFLNFARKNLKNITHTTLDIVDNPTLPQPTSELNILPLLIKKYVMSLAYHEMNSSCEIKFKHNDVVEACDICPLTQMLVTHSADKSLHLWDLKDGTHQASFPIQSDIFVLKFNGDGTLLATVTYYSHPNESHIKIWEPLIQKELCTIKHKHFVYHVGFAQEQLNTTLTAFIQKRHTDTGKIVALWSLNRETAPTFLGCTTSLPWQGETLTSCDDPYKQYYDTGWDKDDKSMLCVTKKHCSDLYSCHQAIHNSPCTITLPMTVRNSKPYNRLTEYEKNIIDSHIIKKAAALLTLKDK